MRSCPRGKTVEKPLTPPVCAPLGRGRSSPSLERPGKARGVRVSEDGCDLGDGRMRILKQLTGELPPRVLALVVKGGSRGRHFPVERTTGHADAFRCRPHRAIRRGDHGPQKSANLGHDAILGGPLELLHPLLHQLVQQRIRAGYCCAQQVRLKDDARPVGVEARHHPEETLVGAGPSTSTSGPRRLSGRKATGSKLFPAVAGMSCYACTGLWKPGSTRPGGRVRSSCSRDVGGEQGCRHGADNSP